MRIEVKNGNVNIVKAGLNVEWSYGNPQDDGSVDTTMLNRAVCNLNIADSTKKVLVIVPPADYETGFNVYKNYFNDLADYPGSAGDVLAPVPFPISKFSEGTKMSDLSYGVAFDDRAHPEGKTTYSIGGCVVKARRADGADIDLADLRRIKIYLKDTMPE